MAFRLLFPVTRGSLARLCTLAAFLVTLFTCTQTSAQTTVEVTVGTPMRGRDRDGLDPDVITYADCVADEEIEFGITLGTGVPSGATFEVWAGTSDVCDDPDQRTTQIPDRCWQVTSVSTSERVVFLPVRDLLPHGASGVEAPATICDDDSLRQDNLTLYFIVANGSDTAGVEQVPFQFDIRGPDAPNITSLGAGEGRLIARWDAEDEGEIGGYRVYCELSGAPEDPTDAGAAGAGSTPPSGECPAPRLRAGERPPPELSRGGTSETGDETAADGLTNFQTYACGVAAYDEHENTGPLSEVLCNSPKPVVDYFEAYRNAGGQAGGGFCAFRRGSGTVGAAMVGLVALAVMLRRRLRNGDRR